MLLAEAAWELNPDGLLGMHSVDLCALLSAALWPASLCVSAEPPRVIAQNRVGSRAPLGGGCQEHYGFDSVVLLRQRDRTRVRPRARVLTMLFTFQHIRMCTHARRHTRVPSACVRP